MSISVRFARLLLALTLALSSLGVLSACTPAAPKPLRVEVWGDSFSAQAQSYINFYLSLSRKATVRVHAFGGTAMCDWFSDMRNENNPQNPLGQHPQVVIIQFFGDAFTNCMHDRNGKALTGPALVNKYYSDARYAQAIFARYKIPVYFMSTPLSYYQSKSYTGLSPVGQVFAHLPAQFPAGHLFRYIDGANPLEWKGKFTYTLPCLSWEKCTGKWANGTKTVVVREHDGFHFCPVNEVMNPFGLRICPVPMPGAQRFALAMYGALARDFKI